MLYNKKKPQAMNHSNILHPSVMNALRNRLTPSQLAKMRKVAPQWKNGVSRKEAKTKVKLNFGNEKRLQLLSNRVHANRNDKYAMLSNDDMREVLLAESGIFRAGMLPNRFIGGQFYNNLWTKENWVVWHAINGYVNYIATGNRLDFTANMAIHNRYNNVPVNTNNTLSRRVKSLENKLWNMKDNENDLRLMDFIQFYRLFTKTDLEMIGY